MGASGGLGIFWNARKVSLCCLYQCHNWISASIKSLKSDLQFILINVYGPISYGEKKQVWNEISRFILNFKDNAFLIGGDFNTILDLTEKNRWYISSLTIILRFQILG